MNRIVQNLIVLLLGTGTSATIAILLIFLEAHSGQPLFSYALLTYIPAGAIAAGLLGALGYLAGSLLLRLRPSLVWLPAFLAVAAGTVFLVQSAECSFSTAGPAVAANLGSFSHFLADAILHTPLQFTAPADPSDRAESPAPSSNRPRISVDADANAQAIGGGVQNMLASQDPTKMAAVSRPMNQINRISDGIDSLNSIGTLQGEKLAIAVLQVAGFLLGALLVFSYLRSLAYCDDCNLFLNRKGAQTRYFVREHEIKSVVENILAMAKRRQLQQSIKEHFTTGSGEKNRFSEFSSTIEVQHCPGCERHKLNYTARRKSGSSWKDISMLEYTASSLEPIDVA